MKTLTMNTGRLIPILGFGTSEITGKDVLHQLMDAALASGYRFFDTAIAYENEADIGAALKDLLPKHHLTRADIFITSKLPPKLQGREVARKACLKSLDDLMTDYLDLFLIHWPGTFNLAPDDPQHSVNRRDSWMELEKLMEEGKLKAIGVSNYTQEHMEELFSHCKIKPALNQVEYHPHLVQESLRAYCQQHDVILQAYSSLGSAEAVESLLGESVVKEIAKEHNKTEAQVLLRWAVEQDIGVLPRSSKLERVESNIRVFDFKLSAEEVAALSSLNKDMHYCWDPTKIEFLGSD